MITFYGSGIIWDPSEGKELGRFDEAGEFTTDNPREIAICHKNGFEFSGEAIPAQEKTLVKAVLAEFNITKLREMAKEAGVEGLWNMNKQELIEALEAGE